MSEKHRIPFDLVAFNVAYMIAAMGGAFAHGNTEFIFYIAVMLLLMVAVLTVHRRVGLSRGVLWAVSVWGCAHMAGGLVPVPESWPINGENRVLYSWWILPGRLKYDHVVHAYGFFVTACLCWECLRSMLVAASHRPIKPTFGMLVLCAAASMGFGALNEVVEFVATLTMANTNVGGYVNTGWDLVSNLVGCVLSMVAIPYLYNPRSADFVASSST